jgi:hypothetical protein
MSKTINKAKLDAAIKLTRDYHENYTDDEAVYKPILHARIDAAHEAARGNWLHLLDIIDGSYGMNREITNEDIYKVLELLGWQVVSDDAGDN